MPRYFYRVARDWVRYFSSPSEKYSERESLNPFHIYEMVVRYEPFWALDLIVATLELDKYGKSIQMLIDGPLTEFVNTHGQTYLEDIVSCINNQLLFKNAMKGVARIDLDEDSWSEICEATFSE